MLQVNQIEFSYHQDQPTIQPLSFQVEVGEHIAIIGESGCGKSTLLHLIYGKLNLDKGNIFWNNTPVLGPAHQLIPGLDDVKLLTQEFDLMPFTTVKENVMKHLSRMYAVQNEERAMELLSTLGIAEWAEVKVKYLSGGQKQRVALAQAIAKRPNLLLLDEPFSHIDQHQKNELRRKLFAYLKQHHITCLFATHDTKDMLSFADKTLVLENGKAVDFRSPLSLYEEPKSLKVASLFEEPNLVSSRFLGKTRMANYLFYPHEIILSFKKGDYEVVIKKAYFMADRYLVSFMLQDKTYFAYYQEALIPETTMFCRFLKIDDAKRRIN